MSYVDGFVVPVPAGKKEAYRIMAAKAWPVFREHGALRHVECWPDNVPEGKVTDFRRSVQAEGGEVVVFSWIEWPSKEVHDAAQPKIMADPRIQRGEGEEMPFSMKRMIYGGFTTMFDERI
jgi:uncharacterized protein YbaA (DUF1428 family)